MDLEAVLIGLVSSGKLKASLLRQFDNLPRDVVEEGVYQGFAQVWEASRKPDAPQLRTREQIEAYLRTTIRRILINARRYYERMVSQDPDFVTLYIDNRRFRQGGGPANRNPNSEAADEPNDAPHERDDVAMEEAENHPGNGTPHPEWTLPPPPDSSPGIEDVLVDEIDGKHLVKVVFQQLDAKYHRIAVQLLNDWEPKEISEAFGHQNPYPMIRWARVKICRVLGDMAAAGNKLAGSLHARGDCIAVLAALRQRPRNSRGAANT
ncbi:MAG TPA: hypothetical protein VMU81_09580 [Acetobacteraceae bacterium]|nr:hypothetical protein [Acetobacteraceae bacterium]